MKTKRKTNTIISEGLKINQLTMISFSHKDSKFSKYYLWRCDCGNERIIHGSAVVSGNTQSCGCYKELTRRTATLLPNHLGVKRQIILQYKRHAKDRGISFNLSDSDFIELLSGTCAYCGIPPSNVKITKNYKVGFKYSGIDRVDSSLGYSKDNCVSCCELCNRSKMAMTKSNFLYWVNRVYEHSIKPKIELSMN